MFINLRFSGRLTRQLLKMLFSPKHRGFPRVNFFHGTKNWIYSKFDLDQKSGSNMIIALIQTLTRVKCVSKMFMALPIHLILDKEEGKCDLNFDSTFDARQRRNQISYEFAMHLIPAKGEVKHVNTFDSSFDAR